MRFQEIQNHNHEILEKVTELEKEAFSHLTEPKEFNPLIEQIENLQKQYIDYKTD